MNEILIYIYEDFGRKPLMMVPLFGNIISGSLMILNIVFYSWDARLLWLSEVYILCGGYSLLSIAMWGLLSHFDNG